MTPSTRSDRPRIYADEDVDRPLIEALQARGFDVLTVQNTRSFGEDDLAQLERAAAAGRVLLTFNRRHFRRHHATWLEDGRAHPGIVTILQGGTAERRALRVAMLLDWLGPDRLPSRFVTWADLQTPLHAGEQIEGYTDADVRMALGLDEARLA
jgi:Domain of unknown function (DUF5615)